MDQRFNTLWHINVHRIGLHLIGFNPRDEKSKGKFVIWTASLPEEVLTNFSCWSSNNFMSHLANARCAEYLGDQTFEVISPSTLFPENTCMSLRLTFFSITRPMSLVFGLCILNVSMLRLSMFASRFYYMFKP